MAKSIKTCKVTHAIKQSDYPDIPTLWSKYKVGDTVTVKRVYWRNGEHHIIGKVNDVSIEIPVVWTDLYND